LPGDRRRSRGAAESGVAEKSSSVHRAKLSRLRYHPSLEPGGTRRLDAFYSFPCLSGCSRSR
jgi:hypothetical protein